jgi:predicted Zn-dependent protease
MKDTVRVTFAAMLAAAALIASGAADAADKAPPSSLTQQERQALQPVQAAIKAKDWQTARTALAPAATVATSPDARYALGRFELEIGVGTNDVQLQADGLDIVIASGGVPASEMPLLYSNQGALALQLGNKSKAADAFTHLVALTPRDPEALIKLAQVKNDLGAPKEAVQLIARGIAVKKASGEKPDESWYKYALKLAYDGRSDPAMGQSAVSLSRALVADYPTGQNWRDALLIFRDTSGLDPATNLDTLRLMRASGALAGERDWYDLADGAYKTGNLGEAKAVLDDGIARGAINPQKNAWAELIRLITAGLADDRASLAAEQKAAMSAKSGAQALKVADAYAGYGEAPTAAALYRAALTKGGVDRNLVNTRLAVALLATGDRQAARATFKSLTGVRADLGAFWLAWLDRSAS